MTYQPVIVPPCFLFFFVVIKRRQAEQFWLEAAKPTLERHCSADVVAHNGNESGLWHPDDLHSSFQSSLDTILKAQLRVRICSVSSSGQR